MSFKEPSVHFWAKALLVGIIIPYAIFHAIFILENDIWGKILSVMFLGLVEYTFFKLTVKEYKDSMGIRPKYKPSKNKPKTKPDAKKLK